MVNKSFLFGVFLYSTLWVFGFNGPYAKYDSYLLSIVSKFLSKTKFNLNMLLHNQTIGVEDRLLAFFVIKEETIC